MDQILQYDLSIFHWINQEMTHPVLDSFLAFMRNQYVWGPLYVFLIAFLTINFGKRGWYLVLFSILVVTASNYLSSELIKKNVKRPRPCNEVSLEGNRRLLVHCGSGYSFTSSHATNHFSFSTFFVLAGGVLVGTWRYWFLLWAAIIAYAQVYVGVHYPFDVLLGSLIGAISGILGSLLFNKLNLGR